ncbi:hypothetical protein NDU88_004774 [Pleurodeles waltl]|uniref:Uncharacterized protein n=1 Tax=Pleurodeles waltl TaxID=8319 RepID=A0AAV7UHN7_PLEWA|nr:hypothetical protein NDU88_004774 [Pleurodeles waltl]
MFRVCPTLREYWHEITQLLTDIVGREVPDDPRHCLLGGYRHQPKHKYTNQFQDLALVLAKREIAMTWKAAAGPRLHTWKREVLKWAKAEETIRHREARRGQGPRERARACSTLINDWEQGEEETLDS